MRLRVHPKNPKPLPRPFFRLAMMIGPLFPNPRSFRRAGKWLFDNKPGRRRILRPPSGFQRTGAIQFARVRWTAPPTWNTGWKSTKTMPSKNKYAQTPQQPPGKHDGALSGEPVEALETRREGESRRL